MKKRYSIFIMILLMSIFGSSIYLVENANTNRQLNQVVWSLHRDYDKQLVDYGRLRLELGALTSLPRVERIASNELGMIFPEKIYEINTR